MNKIVNIVLGPSTGVADVDEDLFTSISRPATPAVGRHITIPGDTSGISSSGSGRESRQSDFQDSRPSGGGTLPMTSDASTDINVERYVPLLLSIV